MLAISLALSMGCGAGRPAEKHVSASPNTEQSLADGVRALCDAPARAEADPDWAKADDGRKGSIVGKHLVEGVENPRALQVANAAPDHQAGDLEAIVKEAGVSPCRLQEVWSPAPAPESEPTGSAANR